MSPFVPHPNVVFVDYGDTLMRGGPSCLHPDGVTVVEVAEVRTIGDVGACLT